MKIHLNNGSSLVLQSQLDAYKTAGTGSTSSKETSFLSKFRSKLRYNKKTGEHSLYTEKCMQFYCLDKVYRRIIGSYKSFFEPLGGVGLTARIFTHDINPREVYINELDAACVQVLRENYPSAVITQYDAFLPSNWPTFSYDAVFADFNNFTLKKYVESYRPFTMQCFDHANKYVIINDCSVFYLSRGPKSFRTYSGLLGLPNETVTVTTYDEFYPALQRFYKSQFPDWTLRSVDRFYASSYLLFEKDENFRKIGPIGSTYAIPPVEVALHTSSDMRRDPVVALEE
jgi:hypothetical protein